MKTRRTKTLCALLFFSTTVLSAMEKKDNTKISSRSLEETNRERELLLHSKDKSGNTPLMYAVINDNLTPVQTLLSCKVDVNQSNDNGCTPLMYAITNGNYEIIQELLSCKADINQSNNNGCTPLTMARNANNQTIVKLLLDDSETLSQQINTGSGAQQLLNLFLDKTNGK